MHPFFTPHTVTVTTITQEAAGAGSEAGAPQRGTATTVSGDFQAKKPSAMFESWGVDTSDPAELYVSVSDADLFAIGYEVAFGSSTYRVVAHPKVRNAGDELDYAQVLLDRVVEDE